MIFKGRFQPKAFCESLIKCLRGGLLSKLGNIRKNVDSIINFGVYSSLSEVAVTKGVDTADFCCGKSTTCCSSFVDMAFFDLYKYCMCVTRWSKDCLF